MINNKYRILCVSLYNDECSGLRILHSILYHNNYDARMLFLKLNRKTVSNEIDNRFTDRELELFKQYILDFQPNLIAFSLVSTNFTLYKRLYKAIKDLGDFKIIVGGWQASLNPQDTLEYADMICVGEGEEVILELVNKLNNNENVDDIQNIWTISNKNSVRPLLNTFNYPKLVFNDGVSHYIENNSLIKRETYKENTRYGTMIGRGCPYHCTYCSNSFLVKNVYHNWSKIRYRTIEHVINELLVVKKELANVERINFYDEVFSPQKEWARELFFQYKHLINLPFYCMFYPGSCDDDTAKLLKESGLQGIWLGIQSGSERVRREIFKRYYSNVTILKQAEIFKNYDINVRYDFIFDNPFETKEETQESIELMRKLPKPCSFNMFSLKYFPNTDITKMALDNNVITQQDIDKQLAYDYQYYLISKEKQEQIENLINV